MKKRLAKHLVIMLCIIMVSLMTVYIGLAVYYHNAFEYGTWINDVYCTGKSIQEVNEELVKDFTYEGVTIHDKDGNSYPISAEEISYQFDFIKALEIYQQQHNSWMWIESLVRGENTRLSPVVTYNGEKLEECLAQLPLLIQGQDTEESRTVAIIKTNQGYELLNERTAVLNIEEAKAAVRAAIEASQTEVFLEEAGCYHDLELTEEMQATLALWEKLDAFQQCGIIYQMGEEQVPVDASVVCDWIALDEEGDFLLDENGELQLREGAVETFVESLAAEYDTVGASRSFTATRGETITVEGGIYGNQLDQQAEIEYLTDAFLSNKRETHEPAYTQKARVQGKDDIGDTYIEIDMGEQMMYYYAEGVLQLETPVVTGNTSRNMGTPEGVNYVYLKQTDRILKGEGYASHVNFWMPVKGNIGIHDASWRSSYGGTIYQTNGSHGCINTPGEIMEQLYNLVEVGTPVVMFY
ncbi:MAG: L,D-transpeptidase/peptidoglycan binding protein [Clostridiales bacterium]|nr:L,D-transpeptidase/peptidoglycan binding protein [Clostridiales bacterium]